ncbi:hypothetical protein Cantr_02855 [Candida viswanathii]|uniref:Uncharacterized protein n=1 Tax=Candida viswanathii TaxID=5486 RepID=A0A367YLS7_9ASCO|nr:hypothetical protein Cantr_02855 [Candida viswanathii]
MVVSEYSASQGLVSLLLNINDGAYVGTGIKVLVDQAHNLLGPNLPPALVDYSVGTLINLFGGYPNSQDIPACIVFAVVFGVIMIAHIVILVINTMRGHYFYLSYIWIFYCMMKVIGFSLRAKWGTDVTLVAIGLTSEVFLIVPAIIIVSANLILAQRLFTWRHPVGGSRKLFWFIMIALYGFVSILVAVTILASFVPYLNFLSHWSYRSWIATVQFTAVLVIVYSLTSVALIGLSFWLPTSKDESRYTYQPWWIESFAPFYFVEKGAAQKAEASFMKRNSNHRHATRVIAATHHHFKMVKGLSNKRGDLKHNISMGLLIITTILILIGAIGRAIVVFQARMHVFSSPAESKWFMYVCWGVFEVIINVLYIVGRVDLRFYRPDVLPATVRAIITAEQTYYPSSDEEEDGFHRDRPETYGKLRGRAEHGTQMQQPHPYYTNASQELAFDDDDYDDFEDIDSQEWDFTGNQQAKTSHSTEERSPEEYQNYIKEQQPPYPVHDDKKRPRFDDDGDNESEFNF